MFKWSALGKHRSKLGKRLDKHGITQGVFSTAAGISKNTITKLCSDDLAKGEVQRSTALKIVRTLNRLTGEEFSVEDFWS